MAILSGLALIVMALAAVIVATAACDLLSRVVFGGRQARMAAEVELQDRLARDEVEGEVYRDPHRGLFAA